MALRRSAVESMLRFHDPGGVEDGYEICATAARGLDLQIELYPVKAAVLGVGIDADDGALEPAFAGPELRFQEYLHAVSNLNGSGHELMNGTQMTRIRRTCADVILLLPATIC